MVIVVVALVIVCCKNCTAHPVLCAGLVGNSSGSLCGAEGTDSTEEGEPSTNILPGKHKFATASYVLLILMCLRCHTIAWMCAHLQSTLACSLYTRAYIKMQLASLAKKLIHRTKESEETDR